MERKIFKALRKKTKNKKHQIRILHPVKLFFKNGEKKIFSNKQKLREFIANRLVL